MGFDLFKAPNADNNTFITDFRLQSFMPHWNEKRQAPTAGTKCRVQFVTSCSLLKKKKFIFFFEKIFLGFFEPLVVEQPKDWTGNRGERKSEWHAAKGHKVESHPGPLQRGHSLCTRARLYQLSVQGACRLLFFKWVIKASIVLVSVPTVPNSYFNRLWIYISLHNYTNTSRHL